MTSAESREWEGLQRALAGQYTVERELGRGGMATVYLAHDRKHDRPVALKVLAPDLGAVLGPERFRREIATAARLQHPHVLSVFDSGEAAGRLWFAMPYVEGESLRDRLARERQLPVAAAVRIAREAAQGLHYAHRHGVVHRDVKPENILLTEDGTTLVADFGIARALAAGEADGAEAGGHADRLTGTGLAIGTPAYMSPEQTTGERDVDARSDVYGIGVVLYEMLTGEPPFTGPTPQAVIAKRLSTPAPSARLTRAAVPPALDAALTRALATVPADRYATAAEFAHALDAALSTSADAAAPAPAGKPRRRRVPVGVVLVLASVLVGSGALFAWARARGTRAGDGADAEAPAVTRLAVLPFENLGRPEDAYVADGLTDEIRSKLAGVPGLQVIARASSTQYRQSNKAPQEIAGELGVQYLLTATVRSEPGRPGRPGRIRVSPELVQVGGQSAPVSRWTQAFDADLTDVFVMQADIAGRVAGAMDVALGGGARARLATVPTRNPAAYDAYLRGEAAAGVLSNSTPTALRRALGYYAQAVALDTGFAEAWAQRSRAAALLATNAVPTPELASEARTGADRARALAPGRPAGHLALGDFYRSIEHDYVRARAAYDAGRRLAPGDADLLAGVAFTEQALGRVADAVRDLRAASALDPRAPGTVRRLGVTLLWARQYPEARATADRGLAIAPTSPVMFQNRVMVELAQGDLAAARRVLASAPPELDSTTLVAMMGNYWDLYWVLDDAQQRQLLTLGPAAFDDDRGAWAWVLAQTYGLRGDSARARAYADTARVALEEQIRAAPEDPQRRVVYGLVLATLGRAADGVREAERGAALLPMERDAYVGAYLQHQLARVYLVTGQPGRALDTLAPLLRLPYYLSPGWLRIDPTFAPLRSTPRFERLATGR